MGDLFWGLQFSVDAHLVLRKNRRKVGASVPLFDGFVHFIAALWSLRESRASSEYHATAGST